jgi:hypothetical protein
MHLFSLYIFLIMLEFAFLMIVFVFFNIISRLKNETDKEKQLLTRSITDTTFVFVLSLFSLKISNEQKNNIIRT